MNRQEAFMNWVLDNYSGWDYTRIMNEFIQSGTYPQEFIDWEGEQNA